MNVFFFKRNKKKITLILFYNLNFKHYFKYFNYQFSKIDLMKINFFY